MPDVVVLGAGVIGLTLALECHERGLETIILARDLPEDSDSSGFASPWAGCIWHPFETDGSNLASQCDADTYRRLGEQAKSIPNLLQKIDVIDLSKDPMRSEDMWFKDVVGGIKEVAGSNSQPLPGGFTHGQQWSTYIWDAPRYIRHLGQQVRDKGIPMYRKRLSSLDQAYDLASLYLPGKESGTVDLVINATGLGSKSLLGVEDEDMYPAKGQTVLVRAPNVKRCYMDVGASFVPRPGDALYETTYIVPRPGTSGEVILGGTFLENDYTPFPDPAVAKRILQSAFKIEPLLAPQIAGRKSNWEDIEVISHNVGLRPCRSGGPRIELEHRVLGQTGLGPKVPEHLDGKQVGVVHVYGFGPAGYQQSLGAASRALELVEKWRSTRT